jgi:hypothetical protein
MLVTVLRSQHAHQAAETPERRQQTDGECLPLLPFKMPVNVTFYTVVGLETVAVQRPFEKKVKNLQMEADRPRARVIRACAVGTARRGARIGRLGAPCKAGVRCCSLTHGCRCPSRRTPQIRAIGGSVDRAALRLETGRATCRSRATQDTDARRARFGRALVV